MSLRHDTSPRFIAEWVKANHVDPDTGEFDPDLTEYGASVHASLVAAQDAAVAAGKAANVSEWARVRERNFDPSLRIDPRAEAAWDTVRTWSGDWDGHWEET